MIPNGIDLTAFTTEHRALCTVHCLILSRICPEKNIHEALDAARLAGVRVILAGELFPYGEHEAYFEREIAPRLGADAEWVGPIRMPEKENLLASAKCVLISSRAPETSSLTAMEALACGTPVIAYDSGALREVVGRGGVIVNGVNEMAEAIRNIDSFDRTLCRAEAVARFDARVMASRYLALYELLGVGNSTTTVSGSAE